MQVVLLAAIRRKMDIEIGHATLRIQSTKNGKARTHRDEHRSGAQGWFRQVGFLWLLASAASQSSRAEAEIVPRRDALPHLPWHSTHLVDGGLRRRNLIQFEDFPELPKSA